MCYPPSYKGTSSCIGSQFWFGSLKDMMPLHYNQCGYLFGWVEAFHVREVDYFVLHSEMGVTYPFHSLLFCLALPTVTQFSDWSHSSLGSLTTSINGYRCHSLCITYMSLLKFAARSLYLWSSPIFSGCSIDVHGISCIILFFHTREALLVGHWVTALPLFSCGILFSSPLLEVVLHGVGLVHLSHV